jgi:hypothetical protein
MAGESEFRLCLMGGRRRSALTPPEQFQSEIALTLLQRTPDMVFSNILAVPI